MNMDTDQFKRMESPEINPFIYDHVIWTQKTRILNVERIVFNNGVGKLDNYMYNNEIGTKYLV